MDKLDSIKQVKLGTYYSQAACVFQWCNQTIVFIISLVSFPACSLYLTYASMNYASSVKNKTQTRYRVLALFGIQIKLVPTVAICLTNACFFHSFLPLKQAGSFSGLLYVYARTCSCPSNTYQLAIPSASQAAFKVSKTASYYQLGLLA